MTVLNAESCDPAPSTGKRTLPDQGKKGCIPRAIDAEMTPGRVG